MKLTSKQIRKNRIWNHFLYWLNCGEARVFRSDWTHWPDYNPEDWRSAFEHFQTYGRKGLTQDQLEGVYPLINAQAQKEILLNSLAEESLEYKAKGWGWLIPWQHTLEMSRTDRRPLDRLTKVAMLRTIKTIEQEGLDFYYRHPGISPQSKQRYFSAIAT